jgi:hypothetical protein
VSEKPKQPHGLTWLEELPGTFTENQWIPPEGSIPYEEWEKALDRLKAERERTEKKLDSLLWWISDFLNYGEGEYRERMSQALSATDYKKGTLQTVQWIGGSIQGDLRGMTSFWKTQPAAGLKDESKKRTVLEKAREEDLSYREIQEEVEGVKKGISREITEAQYEEMFSESAPQTHAPDPHTKTCPTCGGAGTIPENVEPLRQASPG